MKLKKIHIKNFRGIIDLSVSIDNLNILIGDNGTGKTSILEAINLCLSSSYAASRLDINDFHKGAEEKIEIEIEFTEPFSVDIRDGFAKQQVVCNKVRLVAKKRDKASAGKAFSNLVTASHYVVPVAARGKDGWTQKRKNNSDFNFTERDLSLSEVEADFPQPFYFSKSRNRQLVKGYNSSITNIIDDLNWRFDRGQRGISEDAKLFKHDRRWLHQQIETNTDGDTLDKTINAANKTLESFGVSPVGVSLFKTRTPYDNLEVVFPLDGFELPVEQGGSGIEMVTSLALLEAMARISRSTIVLIIDEPELHLHPKLQTKLLEHLKSICSDIQIVVSTHSPILFKNLLGASGVQLIVTKSSQGVISINDAKNSGFGLLKWSPSWGEICHFAYGFPTQEFHDDLYSTIEDSLKSSPVTRLSQEDVENWLVSKGQTKEIKWPDPVRGPREETLMTYVRNKIHHPENIDRPTYSPAQLQDSIERMIALLTPSESSAIVPANLPRP